MHGIRLAIYGGVLFGVAVLAGIYYINIHSRAGKTRPGASRPPPQSAPVDPQAAVLQAIRGSRPGVQVEILHWWPPKWVAIGGPDQYVCRAIYRLTEGQTRIDCDGAYDVGRGGVRPVQDGPESAQTHRDLDRFFPCENCAFNAAAERQ